jgi:hypothetical protein
MPGVAERISLLVTVKAYPAISEKYGEVVCVAGIRTDTPQLEWARLHPVAFRDLPFAQRFNKWTCLTSRRSAVRSRHRPLGRKASAGRYPPL